jgi:hypothetical protein
MSNGPSAPHPPLYFQRPKQVVIAGGICALMVPVTVIAAGCAWVSKSLGVICIAGAAWAILPPVWFWYEYFYLFRVRGNPAAFEQFRYGQQLAIAIWAGVGLALFALANSEHFKGG